MYYKTAQYIPIWLYMYEFDHIRYYQMYNLFHFQLIE